MLIAKDDLANQVSATAKGINVLVIIFCLYSGEFVRNLSQTDLDN